MYEYIVHVERRHIRDWEINVGLSGQRGRSYIYFNSDVTQVDRDVDWMDLPAAETWYCSDETSAKALALKISTEAVGRNINIYKLVSVARSQAANPTITPYNEKGLIPE